MCTAHPLSGTYPFWLQQTKLCAPRLSVTPEAAAGRARQRHGPRRQHTPTAADHSSTKLGDRGAKGGACRLLAWSAGRRRLFVRRWQRWGPMWAAEAMLAQHSRQCLHRRLQDPTSPWCRCHDGSAVVTRRRETEAWNEATASVCHAGNHGVRAVSHMAWPYTNDVGAASSDRPALARHGCRMTHKLRQARCAASSRTSRHLSALALAESKCCHHNTYTFTMHADLAFSQDTLYANEQNAHCGADMRPTPLARRGALQIVAHAERNSCSDAPSDVTEPCCNLTARDLEGPMTSINHVYSTGALCRRTTCPPS